MASEFLRIAERLLDRERRSMSAREMVEIARERQLLPDRFAGKTPHQTMKAKLSVDIRRKGKDSVFVRTGPGRFFLRRLLDKDHAEYHATPLQPPLPSEQVLVFPQAWMIRERRFQGVRSRDCERYLKDLYESGVLTYLDRQEAEENPDYKQIVTYVMVTRRNMLLRYHRGNFNRVADFLRGVACVGFGGHVAATDASLFGQDTYGVFDSAARELSEELKLPDRDRRRLELHEGLEVVGILNDDSSPVGEKHFAILMRYEVSDGTEWDEPERNEKSITRLRWFDPGSSSESLFSFEYWSQLCLLAFYQGAELSKPTYQIQRRAPFRPPHLLAVLGGVGSGKSFTTEILKADFGYHEINSGRVLAELSGLPPVTEATRPEFQHRAWEFIQAPNGPEVLASAIWERVVAYEGARVLVDGVRQRQTLLSLRELCASRRFGIIYVHTPPFLAFEFYQQRAGRRKGIRDYMAARNAPVEREVWNMIELADAVLFNWHGQVAYKRAVHQMMADLGVKP